MSDSGVLRSVLLDVKSGEDGEEEADGGRPETDPYENDCAARASLCLILGKNNVEERDKMGSRVGKAKESLYANDFPDALIAARMNAVGIPGAETPALRGMMTTVAL